MCEGVEAWINYADGIEEFVLVEYSMKENDILTPSLLSLYFVVNFIHALPVYCSFERYVTYQSSRYFFQFSCLAAK